MLNIKVSVKASDIDIESMLEKILDDDTRTEIQRTFAEIIDPWTPYWSGNLHTNITVTPNGVTYNAPYSAKKYYGTVSCKDHHPLATSHWDIVAMQSEHDTLVAKVQEIIDSRVRELNG